jgi:4-amino-4-deoxy-L-arabinose transferase-like glycosyltransferase
VEIKLNPQLEKLPKSLFQSRFFPLACLFFVGVTVFFSGLGNSRLWDQDEGYFASAAAEMYSRADVIVPTYNGELFSHKPPMMYWGMMLGFRLFGVNEFGARFFSAVLGLATVIVVYFIGRRLFDARTAFFSAIALATSVFFTIVSRAATPDSYLTFFVSLAFLIWIRELDFERVIFSLPKWTTWAATYFLMALAVLTKGPIGFLFPAAVIGLFLMSIASHTDEIHVAGWGDRFRQIWNRFGPRQFFRTIWIMRPFTAIAVLLIVAGPWYAIVGWQTEGKFLQEFFGVHHFGRFSQSMDNHSGSFFFYLTACLIGLYPWSGFAIPVALQCGNEWRKAKSNWMGLTLALCWAGVYLMIFSLASTKLANYVLPAYPALALMIGRYFSTWYEQPESIHRGWRTTAIVLLAVVGTMLAVGLPLSVISGPADKTLLDRFSVHPELQLLAPKLALFGVPLLLAGCLGLYFCIRGKDRSAITVFAGSAFLLMICMWQWVVPSIDQLQTPQNIVQQLRKNAGDQSVDLTVVGHFRPSMVFYLGEPIRFYESIDELIEEVQCGTVDTVVLSQSNYQDLSWRMERKPQIANRYVDYIDKQDLVLITAAASDWPVVEAKQTAQRRPTTSQR